jgi:hypothetical protein
MRWQLRAKGIIAVGTLGFAGCATTPPLDNPYTVQPAELTTGNPINLAPGQPTPDGYAEVYDRVLDALDDYFVIKPGDRYSGVIETYPRVAPGLEQPWKPSTPDMRERTLATLQSMRQYAVVRIWAGEQGGYKVYVEVYKELEDAPGPVGSRSGPAFRDSATVDRRGDLASVTGTKALGQTWLPAGPAPHRDFAFEQVILKKIQNWQGFK